MRDDRQRLDKWLWFARFARTRPAAVRLVEEGHVRVASKRVENPALGVKPGDVLTLALPHATLVVRVTAFAERRGSYEQAQTLYEVLSGGERGDQLVKIVVETPVGLSARQKELLNAFQASLSDSNNPRRKAYKDELEKRFPN